MALRVIPDRSLINGLTTAAGTALGMGAAGGGAGAVLGTFILPGVGSAVVGGIGVAVGMTAGVALGFGVGFGFNKYSVQRARDSEYHQWYTNIDEAAQKKKFDDYLKFEIDDKKLICPETETMPLICYKSDSGQYYCGNYIDSKPTEPILEGAKAVLSFDPRVFKKQLKALKNLRESTADLGPGMDADKRFYLEKIQLLEKAILEVREIVKLEVAAQLVQKIYQQRTSLSQAIQNVLANSNWTFLETGGETVVKAGAVASTAKLGRESTSILESSGNPLSIRNKLTVGPTLLRLVQKTVYWKWRNALKDRERDCFDKFLQYNVPHKWICPTTRTFPAIVYKAPSGQAFSAECLTDKRKKVLDTSLNPHKEISIEELVYDPAHFTEQLAELTRIEPRLEDLKREPEERILCRKGFVQLRESIEEIQRIVDGLKAVSLVDSLKLHISDFPEDLQIQCQKFGEDFE